MARRHLLAALAGAAVAIGLVVPSATPPASAANCAGTSGVSVVVDFSAFAKGVKRACAPGDPASGLAALKGAGFTYTFVPRQPGLICQINTLPNPCNGAPSNAYWSYWHAVRGGTWQYSTKGAGNYNPAPGTIEGWAFGAGKPPKVRPTPTTTTTR